METFHDIPHYPGYQAGDLGTIRSNWLSGGYRMPLGQWRILSPARHKSGYLQLQIKHENGKPRTKKVHHLVLEAFVGPRPTGQVCRHWPNPDRTDNRLCNLLWGTHKQNADDRDKCGRTVRSHQETVELVFQLDSNGMSPPAIARQVGLSRSGVYFILSGKRWPHLHYLRHPPDSIHYTRNGKEYVRRRSTSNKQPKETICDT